MSAEVDARASALWELISDIALSSRFSTEVSRVEWSDGATGPELSTLRRVQRTRRDRRVVDDVRRHRVRAGELLSERSVIGRDRDVSSIWRYTITDPGRLPVRLGYWSQTGSGCSGLKYAIDAMREEEERIASMRPARPCDTSCHWSLHR